MTAPTTAAKSRPGSRRSRVLLTLVVMLGVPSAALVALEGLSSLLLFARTLTLAVQPRFQEEVSSEYHNQLGWIAKRSFSSPNAYGPAVGVHTNSRRFRGRAEVTNSVPNGKLRAICSGDSFTFGPGVGDDEVWCALLQRNDVETVNMGQGGYGVDQAYLWYKHDALTLDHHVHLLSFITHDFVRMGMTAFLGFGKPKLVLDADSLRVAGVPVPRRDRARTARRIVRAAQTLRSAELLRAMSSSGDSSQTAQRGIDTTGTRDVFARLVADLQRVNNSKKSRLVLIYLPDHTDYRSDAARAWRANVRQIADSLGVVFFDLIPAIRDLSHVEAQSLYIQAGDRRGEFAGTGHFSVAGNRWTADIIRRRLDSLGVFSDARPQ